MSGNQETPKVFSNNMVMQRGEGTSVWGQAYANEFVTLRLGDKEVCGSADENGYFKLTFPKLKAGGPFELVIEGDDVRDPIKFNNIMIGDVWISSGQSNMYWPCNSTGGSNKLMLLILQTFVY